MFVYVIGSENGPNKVGITYSPQKRLKQIRSGNPHSLKVAAAFEVPDRERARFVENRTHMALQSARLEGEWFAVSSDEAIRAVQVSLTASCDEKTEGTLPAMITPAQIRAARAMIGWTQTALAEASGVAVISIKNIERGATDPRSKTLAAIQDALRKAGVVFLEPGDTRQGGAGVRLVD